MKESAERSTSSQRRQQEIVYLRAGEMNVCPRRRRKSLPAERHSVMFRWRTHATTVSRRRDGRCRCARPNEIFHLQRVLAVVHAVASAAAVGGGTGWANKNNDAADARTAPVEAPRSRRPPFRPAPGHARGRRPVRIRRRRCADRQNFPSAIGPQCRRHSRRPDRDFLSARFRVERSDLDVGSQMPPYLAPPSRWMLLYRIGSDRSVCYFVCEQNKSKSHGRISTKYSRSIAYRTRLTFWNNLYYNPEYGYGSIRITASRCWVAGPSCKIRALFEVTPIYYCD